MRRSVLRGGLHAMARVGWAVTVLSLVVLIAPAAVVADGPPPVEVAGVDSFNRVVANGWGRADVGGSWATANYIGYKVDGYKGVVRHSRAGTGGSQFLGDAYNGDAVPRDISVIFRVRVDKLPVGGNYYVYAVARRAGLRAGDQEVRPRLILRPDGHVLVHATVLVAGHEQPFGDPVLVPGLTLKPGQDIWFRTMVMGVSELLIWAKAWPAGKVEPSTWYYDHSATAPWGTEYTGAVGIRTYVSRSATNAPVTFRFDDYRAASI